MTTQPLEIHLLRYAPTFTYTYDGIPEAHMYQVPNGQYYAASQIDPIIAALPEPAKATSAGISEGRDALFKFSAWAHEKECLADGPTEPNYVWWGELYPHVVAARRALARWEIDRREADRFMKIATAAMCSRNITFVEASDPAIGIGRPASATVISGSGQTYTGESIQVALLAMWDAEFEDEPDLASPPSAEGAA